MAENPRFNVDFMDGGRTYVPESEFLKLRKLLEQAVESGKEIDKFIEIESIGGAIISTSISRISCLTFSTTETRTEDTGYEEHMREEDKNLTKPEWLRD